MTRTKRHLVSELDLNRADDQLPSDCVVNFDNLHTSPRSAFRRRLVLLSDARMAEACRVLGDAVGC
ncbi:MAG: hypothetical protein ACR2OB_07880 [Solirubrobacteraceae bacterium]